MELVPTFPAQALRIRPAHVGRVLSVDAVHHDEHGLLLISAGTDGTVHRWSATSGHSLGSPLECGQGWIYSVTVSRADSGSILVFTAGADGTVRAWDVITGARVGSTMYHTLTLGASGGRVAALTSTVTPEGIQVVSAGESGTIRRWDGVTGESLDPSPYAGSPRNRQNEFSPPLRMPQSEDSARLIGGIEALGIRVGAKGALLFAGDSLGNLTTWDLTSCAYVSQIKAHDGPIKDLSVLGGSQGYGHIATAGSDGYIRGWRVGQHESQFELEVGEGGASALAWKQAPKGPSILVAGDSDGNIHRWDLETKKALETVIKAHVGAVQCLTAGYLHRDTAVVLTGGQDGFARMWDLVSGAPLGQPRVPHRGKVQAIATTSGHGNALEIITGGDDGVIRRWDASNGEAIGSPLVGHNAGVRHLILCPMLNNTVLASYGEDHSLRFWSLSTGGAVGNAFGLDLDDRELIESSRLLFTLELPRDRRPHPGHPQWLWRGGDFFANRILVTLNGLGGIERWDLRSGQRLGPMTLLNERVESSAAPYISDLVGVPGDRGEEPLLVSVTADGLLQTFDAFTGQPRGAPVQAMGLDARLKLDRDVHLSLPASSRSTVVVSGDRSFSVWDACSGEQITAPTRFPPGITGKRIAAMALSDGRTLLVVEGRDGYIHRMDAKTTTRVGTSLPTHLGEVSAIAVAAWPWALDYDGWLVVSGGTDGTVVIWPLDMSGGLIGDPKPRTAGSAVASAAIADWESEPDLLGHQPRATAPLVVDDVTANDSIGRTVLAAHLDGALAELAKRHPTGTAVVHIDGNWGSGKTTLVELLISHSAATRWTRRFENPIVVRYDAWRESAIGPTWWSVGAALHRGIRRERAYVTRTIMTLQSAASRVLRPPVLVTATIFLVLAITAAGGWLKADARSIGVALTAVTVLAATALSAGKALFWATPIFGRLYPRSEDSALGGVAAEVVRLRRWTPRETLSQRKADSALGVIGLLQLCWVLPWLGSQVASAPGNTAYSSFSRLTTVLCLIAILMLLIDLYQFTNRKSDKESQEGSDSEQSATSRILSILTRLLLPGAVATTVAAVAASGAASMRGADGLSGAVWVAAPILCLACCLYVLFTLSMLAMPRRPVLLVIDDLDRCSRERVVQVLETVHTMLRLPSETKTRSRWRRAGSLVVLVLADGRWLRQAWEGVYSNFSNTDPYCGIGSNFMHKIFDHTVLVPPLSSEQLALFVRKVTGGGWYRVAGESEPQRDTDEQLDEPSSFSIFLARADRMERALSERSVDELYSPDLDAEMMDVGSQRRWLMGARRAVIATTSRVEDARVTHLLTHYGELLPGNPRLIKRTADAWAMLLALRDHVGHTENQDIIARAAICMVRFPELVDQILHDAHLPERSTLPAEVTRVIGANGLTKLARCYGREYQSAP